MKKDNFYYSLHYPHSISMSLRDWTDNYIQVVSIDPAINNYAIRIEKRRHDGVIETIVFTKTKFTELESDGTHIINDLYYKITKFLDKYKDLFLKSHYFIIERQLPLNYKAVRVSQHTISYFSLLIQDQPLLSSIIEINPKVKSILLEAPPKLTSKQLKVWSVEKATNILRDRGDDYALQLLSKEKKKDDLCDTVLQIEGFFKCLSI